MECQSVGLSAEMVAAELERVMRWVGLLFARPEARDRAQSYLQGLPSEIRRKNSWQLAEEVGDATPYGFQNLLGRASWSADAMRDRLTGDEVYGTWSIRRFLEERNKNDVLAVKRTLKLAVGLSQRAAQEIAESIPAKAWKTISLGSGSKGTRQYRFGRIEINHDLGPSRKRWLLVRESLADDKERSYYVASAPARTSLQKLAQVAGSRWQIEQAFEESKGEVGLDEYEVRSFEGWQRHITLSLLAAAMLVVLRSRLNDEAPQDGMPKKTSG